MERRSIPSGSVRLQERETGQRTISGYGAVFYDPKDPGTQYQLLEDVFERIMPGAFDRALREDDVRSLFNHNPDIVLARNTAGTLKLRVDKRGLFYEASVADTPLIRDQVLSPIQRGEVTGSSFMFVARETAWLEEKAGGRTIFVRELREVDLWEVGPVVFPAYNSTTTGARESDLAGVLDSLSAWRGGKNNAAAVIARARAVLQHEQAADAAEAVAVRARLVEVLEREHAN